MAKVPKIALVTPSFNQSPYIRRTIDSILTQGYPRLDYVVVDGGSTDGTLELLRSYGSRLRWISEPDRGQSDAINKGFRMVEGEIQGYLNSDDVLLPGSLAAVGDFFSQNPNALWLSGFCRIIDAHDRPVQSLVRRYKNFLLRHYRPWTLVMINYISQMATFWRSSAVDRIGTFSLDQHLVMDYEYWLRLSRLGRPGILHQELAAFRLHDEAKSTHRYIEQFRQSAKVAMRQTSNPFLKLLSWVHHHLVIVGYRVLAFR